MHIAFLTNDGANAKGFDRDTAIIGAFEALGQQVTVIDPVVPPGSRHGRWRTALFRRLGYNVFTSCDVPRLRQLACSTEKALAGTEAEVVFSTSTHFTAWLNTSLPVVNWVDAVFDCIVDFYPNFDRLDLLSLRAGHRAERRALHRSELTLLRCFWAAARAIHCYRVPGSKLGVVQAPAVFSSEPRRSEVLAARSGERRPLKCLIVGNDWQRKGADVALEAVRKARGAGLDIHLTALGMKPPPQLQPEPWLEILPRLQKGSPAEHAKLCQTFLDADVSLLPSRADFTPNVICEAYAFGLPTIGSPVGAIPEMIEHGQTGFVTKRVEDTDEYARFLHRFATAPGLLSHMAVESRNKYEAEFALPVVARKMIAHLESVLYRTAQS